MSNVPPVTVRTQVLVAITQAGGLGKADPVAIAKGLTLERDEVVRITADWSKRSGEQESYFKQEPRRGGERATPLEIARVYMPDAARTLAALGLAYESYAESVMEAKQALAQWHESWLEGIERPMASSAADWRSAAQTKTWIDSERDKSGLVLHLLRPATERAQATSIARGHEVNAYLSALPPEVTNGYQIPEQSMAVWASHDKDTWRDLWAKPHLEKIHERLEAYVVTQIVREAGTKVRELEHSLVRPYEEKLRKERSRIPEFLKDAAPEVVVDLAEKTRIQLASMLNSNGFRREPVLRASSNSEHSRDVSASSSVHAIDGQLGLTETPGGGLKLDLGISSTKGVDTFALQERYRHSFEASADAIIPWATQFDVVLLSPATVIEGPIGDLDELARVTNEQHGLMRLHALAVLEKVLFLNELVDHLATTAGGKHLTSELRRWMDTRITFRSAAGAKLGDVVLNDALNDAKALAERLASRGMPVMGPERVQELAARGDNALGAALMNPFELPAPG